jgi:hypothetical protein
MDTTLCLKDTMRFAKPLAFGCGDKTSLLSGLLGMHADAYFMRRQTENFDANDYNGF